MSTISQQKTSISKEDKISTLQQIVALRIEELLDQLDIRLHKSGNKMVGACPVHGGTNCSSLNIYPDGHTVPGYWVCRTHHCQETFKPTIIGFARGVLSHQRYNWTKPENKVLSFNETIEWLCKFVGQELDTIKVDKDELERRRFTAQVASISGANIVKPAGIPRAKVRENLEIPAGFYLERGYSPEVLKSYDVGLCAKQGKEMFNRIVVPVYDDTGGFMVGCSGRSLFTECQKCLSYHSPQDKCIDEQYRWINRKWKHSNNFNISGTLYNYWHAKKYIQNSTIVILVEGPGDVWRLEEAGIHNSVAIFGVELHDEQQIILESSGAMSVVLLIDNDEAGQTAIPKLKKQLERCYRIVTPTLPAKDIGEMNVQQIKELLLPIVGE